MYGKLHCYIGDGKGKTTAAMGLAMRAVENGLSVCVCQFLKDGESAELKGLKKLGVDVMLAPMEGFYQDLAPNLPSYASVFAKRQRTWIFWYLMNFYGRSPWRSFRKNLHRTYWIFAKSLANWY